MINFQVFGLAHLMKMLPMEERTLADRRRTLEALASGNARQAPVGSMLVEQKEAERLSGLVQFALHICKQLEIDAGVDRAERFLNKLKRPMLFIDLEPEMRVLREAVEDGIRYIGFYHYTKAKRELLVKVADQWSPTFSAFHSAKLDADSASDCYALGHSKASVFHAMQVLERGLKALATDVGEAFTTQQWGNIIDTIEGKIKGMQRNGIPGLSKEEKDARLQFLSEAAKEFRYFKDGWRNYVSHGRADYDDDDAKRVLDHVRTFMNHLSTKLSEMT
jgi:HEPN domain-containing protein